MNMRNLSTVLIQAIVIVLLGLTSAPAMAQNAAFKRIEALEFRESTVGEAIRLLARLSGVNIFATRKAASREFSMTVRDTNVRGVVASIARVTGLSYSYDEESNAFILMTNEQFADDVVITRNAETRVFNLRHQNVVAAAKIVESLFGDRVSLNINTDDPDRLQISDGSVQATRRVGQGNNSSNSNNSSGRVSGVEFDASDINPSRLQDLVGPSSAGARLDLADLTKRLGLEPKIFVTINRQHNLLFVRTADRDAMRDIEKIIKETDRPTKQVLLEVRVMSLNYSDDFRSVFNFGLSGNSSKTYTSPSGKTTIGRNGISSGGFTRNGNGLFFQTLSDNLLAQIELLERQNRAKTLSTPMLSASNNSPARLFVGTEAVLARGFSSQTTIGSTGATTTSTQTDVELREVGQTLYILPRINADDTVTLVIQQEISTVVEGGGRVPVIGNNGSITEIQVDTVNTARVGGTVTTMTGTTIAVGGLIRDTSTRGNSKVPILGNVPLLGLMFRGDNSSNERTELILLITPHIYSGGPEGERLARKRLARNSRNVDIDTVAFGETKNGAPSVTLRGQQQHYVPMTRFAAAMRHGVQPPKKGVYRGFDAAPISSGGGLRIEGNSGLKLFGGLKITAEAVESWRKRNLYVTAVVLTNIANSPQPVPINKLRGGWLAATAEVKKLAARNKEGSRTYLYLISDKPYDDVIADLQTGGGL